MIQRTLITWQEFFEAMPRADVEAVVDTALRHLNRVEGAWLISIAAELKGMLMHAQGKAQSSRRLVRNFIIDEQPRMPDLTYGPVVIWSDAKASLITSIQRAAEARGLRFGDVYQYLRVDGIECLPGSLEQLMLIAAECTGSHSPPPYALRLAAFWLCAALRADGETEEAAPESSVEKEDTAFVEEEPSEAELADRVGRELIDWPTIMATLPPAYQAIMLATALKYAAEIRADESFPIEAYRELGKLLDPQNVIAPGYPDGNAPFKHARRALLKALSHDGEIAYTVVALWAGANSHLITEVTETAEGRGLHFGPLTHRCNFDGIYRLPDQVPVLAAIAAEYSRHAAGMRIYDYQLAAHFLSARQLTDAEWATQQKEDAPPDMSDLTSTPFTVDMEPPAPDYSAAPIEPPDAGGRVLLSWAAFTDLMEAEERREVADIVLRHSHAICRNQVEANAALKAFATVFDRRLIEVDGYTRGLAPYKELCQTVADNTTLKPHLNYYLFSIWADAKRDVLIELAEAAEAQGWHFGAIGQRIDRDGIYLRVSRIEDFHPILENLITHCEDEQRAHVYIIGSFWLLAAELSDEEWAAYSSTSLPPWVQRLGIDPEAAERIMKDQPPREADPAASPAESPEDWPESPAELSAPLDESLTAPLDPPAANGRSLMPWDVITEVMPIEYQEAVVEIALHHSRAIRQGKASFSSAVLQEFADLLDRRKIAIKGYLPGEAPFNVVRRHWLTLITDFPELNLAVVGLWASANHRVISELQRTAEAQGCHFGPVGNRITEDGIYGWPEQIDQLGGIAIQISRKYSPEDQLHYKLAAFWLMASQLTDEEWAARQAAQDQTDASSTAAPTITDQPLESDTLPIVAADADQIVGEQVGEADDLSPESAPPDQPRTPLAPSDLNSRILLPWADVLKLISRDDRRVMIDVALQQSQAIRTGTLVAANETLKDFAEGLAWEHIPIDGYRPGQAPLKAVRHYTQTFITETPAFLMTVMGLWISTQSAVMRELQQAAEEQGWHFGDVSQTIGLSGIYLWPDQLLHLTEIALQVSRRHPPEQAVHFRLAAIWLSTMQLTDEEWAAHQAAASQPPLPTEPSPETPASAEPARTPPDPTAPRRLRDWSDFFRQMPDDLRETLIDIALRQVNRVLDEPYLSAAEVFKNLELKGFRAGKVPHQVAVQHYLRLVNDSPVVAQAVINLWADASQAIINQVRAEAEARGFRFEADWPQRKFVAGYYNDERSQPLIQLAEKLAAGQPILKQHQIFLVAYWFSAAQLLDEIPAVTAEPAASTLDSANTLAIDQAVTAIAPGEVVPPASDAPELQAVARADKSARNIMPHEVRGLISANLVSTDDLPTIRQQLRADLWSLDKLRQAILPDVRSIIAAVEASNLSYSEERFDAAHGRLAAWRIAYEQLYTDVQIALTSIKEASNQRPGFNELDVAPDPPQEPNEYAQSKVIAADLIVIIDALLDYDRTREAALKELAQCRAQWADRLAQLAVWGGSAAVITPPDIDGATAPLIDLEEAVTRFSADLTQVEDQLKQLRAEREARLTALLQQLREAELEADALIAAGRTLDEFMNTRWADLPAEVLIALEAEVAANRETLLAQARQNETSALAARWRATADEAGLLKLLGRLVRDRREIDAALLIFSVPAAQPATGLRPLSAPIVRGVFMGLLQLSTPSHPFDLLSGLAPELHSGWLPVDQRARAAWYLGLLGAQYGASWPLPAELWWLLPAPDWPFDNMPRWRVVWQAARAGQPLPAILPLEILREQIAARTERLNKARGQLDQLFIRENGWLPRLRTIRSKRHIKVFNQNLSPLLVQHLMILRQADAELDKYPRGDRSVPLARLEQQHHEFADGTTDAQLEGEYEKMAEYEKLDDSDPVQRRATIKVWQDCVYALIEYGAALIAYWRGELARANDLTQEQLEAELGAHPDLVTLGQMVLKQLIKATPVAAERDETQARSLAEERITAQVLSTAEIAARLPRTMGLLATTDCTWAALLDPLLTDLVEPLNAADAAWLWLDRDLPDQVLLLAAHLPIELQKRAQSLRTDLERSVAELQADVIKLGGEVDDLAEARTLGRWAYVRDRLQRRLTDLQAKAETDRKQRAEQALALRRWINELDEAVFQVQDTLPEEVYALVEQGLALARRAVHLPALGEAARAFLQEIDYRLTHQAWPTAFKLQETIDQLEHALSGAQSAPKVVLAAEDVLKVLEQEDLTALGVFAHPLSSSGMGTRADLLRNWLRVRGLPSFLSDELAQSDRQALQALFRYFARLMSMKRVHSLGTGAALEFDDPTVYAYYELRYPKTDALRDHCILVSLPGNPPRASEVAQLQDLLDEKGWLDDAFVLVFVPGSTPRLAKRLAARRLVIIDETLLLEWVLAERKYTNPLSRLRPRLLNSIGAANVEIFKINQLVNSRTGIFVGRERDVERVASSDANFAIYGGRRIGKSSFLKSIDDHLRERKTLTAWLSVEGQADLSDNASAARLARQVLGAESPVTGIDGLKPALQVFMDSRPELNLVIFIDEIDKYIVHNPDRHVLIEALRSLSNLYPGRFRTIVAGFTDLYDCLKGRGPYSPTSDPWRRMFNDLGGPLGNLLPENAEKIVSEGFAEILGWEFEKRAVPQLIVERTGSHPAFIQKFCLDLQRRVAQRGDGLVRLDDIDAVFGDDHPENSFIAYVRDTLKDNLDPIGRYLSVWLAREAHQQRGFTWDEAREITGLLRVTVHDDLLERSLERLKVTSVVRERAARVYEFSVPDYPLILARLGETLIRFDQLEREIAELVEGAHGYRRG